MDIWYYLVIVADSFKISYIMWEKEAFCIWLERRYRASHYCGAYYRLRFVSFLFSHLKFLSIACRRSSISRVQATSRPETSIFAGDAMQNSPFVEWDYLDGLLLLLDSLKSSNTKSSHSIHAHFCLVNSKRAEGEDWEGTYSETNVDKNDKKSETLW